jgi:hypothetical protein
MARLFFSLAVPFFFERVFASRQKKRISRATKKKKMPNVGEQEQHTWMLERPV